MENLDQKQKYLCHQILDQGYDSQQFVQFCKQYKQNGHLIQLWSLQQLIQCVTQFKNKHSIKKNEIQNIQDQYKAYQNIDWEELNPAKLQQKKKIKQQQNSQQNDDLLGLSSPKQILLKQTVLQKKLPNQKSTLFQVQKNKQIKIKPITMLIKKQKYQIDKEIKCLKLHQTKISSYDIVKIKVEKCILTSKEKMLNILSTLFPASKQTLFIIKTQFRNKSVKEGSKWEVQRTYQEIKTFRNILQKFYPGNIISFLPKELASTSIEQIERLKLQMQLFFNYLLMCKDIRCSKYFEGLLTFKKPDFIKLLESSQKSQGIQSLQKIINGCGKVQLIYQQDVLNFTQNLSIFMNNSINIFTKIQGICKKIQESFKSLQIYYKQISSTYVQLSNLSQQLFRNLPYNEIICLGKVYNGLSQSLTQISKTVIDEVKVIQNYKNYNNYIRKEFQMINKFAKKRQLFYNALKQFQSSLKQLDKQGINLFGKINSIFSKSSSQIMNKPSKSKDILKDQLGFYNYQIQHQSLEILKIQKSYIIQSINELCHNFIQSIEQKHEYFSHVLVKVGKMLIIKQ